MKTKITLTVEIEHSKNTSIETIKECLTTAMKETFWTDDFHAVNVYFPEEKDNGYLIKQLNDLENFVASLGVEHI